MAGTWFWMSGTSETYDYWERKSVWSETSPCGAIATSAPFKWNDIPCGEHLHFICLKGEESSLIDLVFGLTGILIKQNVTYL